MTKRAPERAHVLAMTVRADTADDLAAELRGFSDLILRGQLTTGVMGGAVASTTYSYRVRPEQTHDAYFAEVSQRITDRRARVDTDH